MALIIAASCIRCEAQSVVCDSIIKYKTHSGCVRVSMSEELFVTFWVDSRTLDTIHSNLVILEQENDSIRSKEELVKRELKDLKESMQKTIDLEVKDKSFVEHSLEACKQYNSDLTIDNEKLNAKVIKLKRQRKGAFLIGYGLGTTLCTLAYLAVKSLFAF